MQGLSQTLRNLGVVRLAAIGVVAIGTIVFFVFLSARLNSVDMSLLYADLDTGDTAKIVTKLESMGIPFKLRAGGRQIMVPSDQALRLRMTMAEEGLPNGGSVGYEIFDRSASLGVTNFVQNVNLLRALEGELGRTVRSLGDVQEARVHLVLPKRELFSRRRQEPTASVVVKTRGRKKLSKSNILSIQHLVAAAVPGLKLSRIAIIDDRGRLLARAAFGDESDNLIAGNNDEMQRVHEERLIRTIEEMLEQSIGIGKIRAQVTAEMDFDRITTNSEIFDPDGQVVRSTQSVEETADSTDRNSKKTVSVANNLPGSRDSQGGGEASASRSNRIEETVNYEISKTIKTHVRETGRVRRLSIAVLVDGSYSKNENGEIEYKPREQEQLDKLARLVRSAVGFDAKRGDNLEIINMRFVNAVDEDLGGVEPLFGLTKADYFRIAEIFVLAAVGILVILLVVRPLVSRTLEALPGALATAEQNLLAAHSADARALASPSDTGVAGLPPEEDPADDLIDVASVDGKVRASALKKIEEIVERHPEETVGIIRQWMNAADG